MKKKICERFCKMQDFLFMKEDNSMMRLKWAVVQEDMLRFKECVFHISDDADSALIPAMSYEKCGSRRTDRLFNVLEPTKNCPYYAEHFLESLSLDSDSK